MRCCHAETLFFESEKRFVDFLFQKEKSANCPSLFLGGHFLLGYDRGLQSLFPLIWQDAKTAEQRALAQTVSADFPVVSFATVASIIKKLGPETQSKIMLLVDDHQYTRMHGIPTDAPHAQLRKEFFRAHRTIPHAYLEVLDALELDEREVILRNDDKQRSRNDILPRLTPFYSEQTLRNQFMSNTRKALLRTPHFAQPHHIPAPKLYYIPEVLEEHCLTNAEGKCDCSGEVIELIALLVGKGWNRLVLLVPAVCGNPVRVGVEAALTYLAQISANVPDVTVVSRAGEEPASAIDPIEVTVCQRLK